VAALRRPATRNYGVHEASSEQTLVRAPRHIVITGGAGYAGPQVTESCSSHARRSPVGATLNRSAPYYRASKKRESDFATRFIELAPETDQQVPYPVVRLIPQAAGDHGVDLRGARANGSRTRCGTLSAFVG
jgi:hypothetical protein